VLVRVLKKRRKREEEEEEEERLRERERANRRTEDKGEQNQLMNGRVEEAVENETQKKTSIGKRRRRKKIKQKPKVCNEAKLPSFYVVSITTIFG